MEEEIEYVDIMRPQPGDEIVTLDIVSVDDVTTEEED